MNVIGLASQNWDSAYDSQGGNLRKKNGDRRYACPHISIGLCLNHFNGFFGAFRHALFAADAFIFIHGVQFLELSADGIYRTHFGTDCAANAAFRIDLRFFAASCQQVLNRLCGADRGAQAAIDAFIIVNTGQVVRDGDGLHGTFTATDSATDAGMGAATDGFGIGAFLFGRALDIDIAIDGNQSNEPSGTCFHTCSTGGALVIIDHAHAIGIDGDRVKGAGRLTVV